MIIRDESIRDKMDIVASFTYAGAIQKILDIVNETEKWDQFDLVEQLEHFTSWAHRDENGHWVKIP